MAAGPARIIERDDRPSMRFSWQALKAPTGALTAATAAQLTTNLRDVSFAEDTVDFADVSGIQSLAVQIFGVSANNGTGTLEIYGWNDTGPGHHIAQVTLVFGNFTSAATTGFHAASATASNIRRLFAPATAYQGCDTFAIGAQYGTLIEATTAWNYVQIQAVAETDFPAEFVVNMHNGRFKYLGVLDTVLSGTSIGAIYKPLSYFGEPVV